MINNFKDQTKATDMYTSVYKINVAYCVLICLGVSILKAVKVNKIKDYMVNPVLACRSMSQ